MPLLEADHLRALLDAGGGEDEIVCFREASGRRHPFPGLFPRSLLAGWPEAIVSLQWILDRPHTREVDPGPLLPGLLNVNRPGDLPG